MTGNKRISSSSDDFIDWDSNDLSFVRKPVLSKPFWSGAPSSLMDGSIPYMAWYDPWVRSWALQIVSVSSSSRYYNLFLGPITMAHETKHTVRYLICYICITQHPWTSSITSGKMEEESNILLLVKIRIQYIFSCSSCILFSRCKL
jgi:hypothetical protein